MTATEGDIPDDDGIASEEGESIHGRWVESCDYANDRVIHHSLRTRNIRHIPELSSAVASSTINRFGLHRPR